MTQDLNLSNIFMRLFETKNDKIKQQEIFQSFKELNQEDNFVTNL